MSVILATESEEKKGREGGLLTSKRPLHPTAVPKAPEHRRHSHHEDGSCEDQNECRPVSVVTEEVTRFKFFSKTILVHCALSTWYLRSVHRERHISLRLRLAHEHSIHLSISIPQAHQY
jgi:hypothetical protein